MHERILRQMQASVRARDYVVTTHAEEEMDADGLSILEKYVLRGRPLEAMDPVGIVAKIGPTGQLVVPTVYIC